MTARARRAAPTAPRESFARSDALAGRRALVTGGTRGIGRAIAVALAEAGAAVTVTWARDERDAADTADAFAVLGRDHAVVRCDVARAADVTALFARLAGPAAVDVLVNNAAIARDGTAMMLSDAAWTDVLATNLTGPFLCIRPALRGMIARGFGRIVNVISPAGLMGKAGAANYAAAKAGLLALTRSLAAEVAPFGITANCVCPGVIETRMLDGVADAARAAMVAGVPAGRLGLPQEVAHAVLFLALPHAAYVNGAVLSVDGGLLTG